jgi:predicted DsbA family dithiol-disulfide isomerase
MKVEVWSDVACPWCYIGKRRFERALAVLAGVDGLAATEVDVRWRSFELNPGLARGGGERLEPFLARQMGRSVDEIRAMNARVAELAAAEGLDYHFERYRVGNTRDAHRLAHLAATRGLGAAMHERLFRAQLVEGIDLEDHAALAVLGEEVGLSPAEARQVLASDAFSDAVARDFLEAQALGCTGVPFFVVDRRYAVSGAREAEVFAATLRRARADAAGGAVAPAAVDRPA